MIPSVNLDNQNAADIFDAGLVRMRQYYGSELDTSYQDPGVALLELFSILKDMQQFYMNYVSDAHKLAYIRLFGFEPPKAEPAKTLLEFQSETLRTIPKGFLAKAGEIPFETTEPLYLSDNRIAVLLLKQANALRVAQEGEAFEPFGRPARTGNALYIGFEQNIQEMERIFIDREDTITPFPLGRLQIEAFTADEAWERVPFTDDTCCLQKSGAILFEVTSPMKRKAMTDDGSDAFWIRLVLEESAILLAPRINGVWLNVVPALQQENLTLELGRANGTPNQKIRFPPCEIVKLEIHVDSGRQEWTQVEDFSRSGALDHHFCVEGDTILFGNDEHGAAAPAGIVHLTEGRKTMGADGNVQRGLVRASGRPDVQVHNIRAASGGRNAAGIDQMLEAVRRDTFALQKAVTLEDYRRVLKEMPTLAIDEVKAIMDGNTVVLFVKPKSDSALPVLNSVYRQALRDYLEPFRMLTAQVRFESPVYYEVTVSAELSVSNTTLDPLEQITAQLHTLLPRKQDANVFCDSLSYGELYGLIAHLPFVMRVNRLQFECGGKRVSSGFFPVGAGGIVYLEDIRIKWI